MMTSPFSFTINVSLTGEEYGTLIVALIHMRYDLQSDLEIYHDRTDTLAQKIIDNSLTQLRRLDSTISKIDPLLLPKLEATHARAE